MDVLLLPGFWLDGSSWGAVVPALEVAGHRTHPLTLPSAPGLGLRDQVEAVVGLVDELDGPVALVAHSGGGSVAHAAVDARPDRVAHAVYVDTWPVAAGHAINPDLPVVDGMIPLPDWSFFDDEDLVDLTDELRASFEARAIPVPAAVANDLQVLGDERRFEVPVTVIACEFPSARFREWLATGESTLADLARIRSVTWVDLPTGHWPQFTKPAELAAAVVDALREA